VDDQPCADGRRVAIAELDHLFELVGRVDVQQRKRNRSWKKRLLRQAQQDRRVLADRVQHHRALELGDDLAHDVDTFGFERPQMIGGRGRIRGFCQVFGQIEGHAHG
jgi:hypothetical protein